MLRIQMTLVCYIGSLQVSLSYSLSLLDCFITSKSFQENVTERDFLHNLCLVVIRISILNDRDAFAMRLCQHISQGVRTITAYKLED